MINVDADEGLDSDEKGFSFQHLNMDLNDDIGVEGLGQYKNHVGFEENSESSSITEDEEYKRYLEEFENLVNKESSPINFTLPKYDWENDPLFNEVKRKFEEDDFINEYRLEINDLKEEINHKVEEIHNDDIELLNLKEEILREKQQNTISTTQIIVEKDKEDDKIGILERLQKEMEEEAKKIKEEEKRLEEEIQERKRKIEEERKQREEKRKLEQELIAKQKIEESRLLLKAQKESERKIAALCLQREEEIMKEYIKEELTRKENVKREKERKLEKERKSAISQMKCEESIMREYMTEEKRREQEKLRLAEERKRKIEEEKKRREEERKVKEKEKEIKKKQLQKDELRNNFNESMKEALKFTINNQSWILINDFNRWKNLITRYTNPPKLKYNNCDEKLQVSVNKKGNILDEDVLDNTLPLERDNKKVKYLTIRNEGLDSIKSNVLNCLPNLRALVLDTNTLRSIENLGILPKLESLSVSDNQIAFIQLSKEISLSLKELFAVRNQITSLTSLANCTNLRALNLCNNSIEDIKGLEGNKRLQYLRIDINKLSKLKYLEYFNMLNYLDIGYNEIKELDDSLNYNLLLEDFICYGNKLETVPSFHHVLFKSVYLNSNLITSLPNNFLYAPILQFLNLSSNRIETLSPLTSCVMLKSLNLSFNNIQNNAEILNLRFCRNLEDVKLNDNPIATGSIYREIVISLLPNLHTLDDEPVNISVRKSSLLRSVTYSPRLLSLLISFINHSFTRNIPSVKSQLMQTDISRFMKDAIIFERAQRGLQSLPINEWSFKTTFYYLCTKQCNERGNFTVYHQCQSGENSGNFIENQIKFSSKFDSRMRQYEEKEELKKKHFEEHLNFTTKSHQNVFVKNRDYFDEKNKLDAACKIQRHYRQYLIKKQKKKDEIIISSVKLIQRIWRGYITRKKNLPWMLKKIFIRHKAATVIQSHWKGYRVRAILRKARQLEEDELFDLETADFNFDYPFADEFSVNIKIPEHRKDRKLDVYYYDVHTKKSYGGDEEIKEMFSSTKINSQPKNTESIESVKLPSIQKREQKKTEEPKDSILKEDQEEYSSIQNTSLLSNDTEKSHSKREETLEQLRAKWGFKNVETARALSERKDKFKKIKQKKKLEEERKDPMKRLEKFKKAKELNHTDISPPKAFLKPRKSTPSFTARPSAIETDLELQSVSSGSSSSKSPSEDNRLRLPKLHKRNF
ncbi:hypothetical protein ABK040_008276 [Willaertia magna]